MREHEIGLTKLYNALKAPDCTDDAIVHLRRLHEDMDAAVLAAYGWSHIEVPAYCPATDADHKAVEAFTDEVLDRLFVLNAERAEEEQVKGRGSGSSKKGKKTAGSQPSLGLDE